MTVADELYRVTSENGLILIGDIFSSERRHLIPPSEVEALGLCRSPVYASAIELVVHISRRIKAEIHSI